jgi:hypothetical protein
MEQISLYEQVYEGKQVPCCENCELYEECQCEMPDVTNTDGVCDGWIKQGNPSVFDEVFGIEEPKKL